MKPLRIEITNFGAITHVEIDLTNVTMAAICGANGAGKSTAFTVAPRFALFGATKSGCSVDDMVRTGTTEAIVIFDFEHQGATWRVIRTRSTKGKGKSTLELQRQSGDLWASESGASIAETQKKIIDLLNLDDDTFVCSSMILQNKANEFTSRPAGQRKAILTQILQLDQYDILQEKAKAKVQEVTAALTRVKDKIADIDLRLADKSVIEGEKLDLEIRLKTAQTQILKLDADVQAAQLEHTVLLAQIQQAGKIHEQAQEKRSEISTKSAECARQQQCLNTAQQLLDRKPLILGNVAQYEATKEQVISLRVKRDQQEALRTEAERLKTELAGVQGNVQKVQADIVQLEKNLADRERLVTVKAEYDQGSARLIECQKLQEEDQRLMAAYKECQNALLRAEDRYQNQEKEYQQSIASLEEKMNMLAYTNCIDIDNAQCRFLSNAVAAKAKLPTVREEYATWKIYADNEIRILQEEVLQAKTTRLALGFNPLEPYELQEKINRLKPDVDLLGRLDAMAPLLQNLRDQLTDLTNRETDINTRLQAMREQYAELSEGLKQLPALETQMATLEPWLKSKEQLPAAQEVATTAKKTIDRLQEEIDVLSAQALALEQEYETLIGDSKGLEEQSALSLQNLQNELKKVRDDHTHLTGQFGAVQAKLDALAQDEVARQQLVEEMEPLAKALPRWQTLVKAFGRDGIPALIIENAVPELERIANDILGQMSGGKNYLRFETQKELKSRSGLAETLDIIVGDWAGERIYETFSGGEQLRIDFAIRFALAELLARRAGARVDWLTIDEGFGSQSEEFLPMVIDAVKQVAHRFGLVLVISHVKAVQEAFAQRIEFQPAREEGEATGVKVA